MSTKDPRALDEADRRILRALQQDARLTIAQIAERVGLSQTPCWNRLKRLERDGFIEGYVAILNQEKLGYPETVMIEIVLDRHDEEAGPVWQAAAGTARGAGGLADIGAA